MITRHIDADDVAGDLAEAAAELRAAAVGTAAQWVLPAGTHPVTAPLTVAVEGRTVHVIGNGAVLDAHIPGGAVLRIAAEHVDVDDVGLIAQSDADVVGLDIEAVGGAAVRGLRVTGVTGAEDAIALRVDAPSGAIFVSDISIEGVRAEQGGAQGFGIVGDTVQLTGVRIGDVRGEAEAVGMVVSALRTLDVSVSQVSGIRGIPGAADLTAAGVQLSAGDPAGGHAEISILDLAIGGVRADGDATGIQIAAVGDVAIRGLSAEETLGGRASGVVVVVTGACDWLGGTVRDVRSTVAGAVGVRLLVTASPRDVTVGDVHVEEIRGAAATPQPPGLPGTAPPESWATWADAVAAAIRGGAGAGAGLPAPPAPDAADHTEQIVGVCVVAPVSEYEPWLTTATDAGPVVVADSTLRRISGTALQVAAELRDVRIRGIDAWTSVDAAWIDGERVQLAQGTWHRHHRGIAVGGTELTVSNMIVTQIDEGPGIRPRPETVIAAAAGVIADAPDVPGSDLPPAQGPYRVAGPATAVPQVVLDGGTAPRREIDLRLSDVTLHDAAVRVPGDPLDAARYIGAYPPDADPRCELRDPLPASATPASAPLPSPVADYRVRDAHGLLRVMLDRADVVMPGWSDRNPADMTTMLFELLANRLDHEAYNQEVALSEGYLPTAQQRRSVEDHVRLVDYDPDPGLSATTMAQFSVNGPALGLDTSRQRVTIGAGTLIGNPDPTDSALVFSTTEPLAWDAALDRLRMVEDVARGAVSMILDTDLVSLERLRWLVLLPDDDQLPAHVVRATVVELSTDSTLVLWDPRRPAPIAYAAETTTVLGNVVPVTHGVPLSGRTTTPGGSGTTDPSSLDALLAPWHTQLQVMVDNRAGTVREIELPFADLSRIATGWGFPGEPPRRGTLTLDVTVNGEPWTQTDTLTTSGPNEEMFAARPGQHGGTALRVGDGINGAALPRGVVDVRAATRVGLGARGNVAAHTLTVLLRAADDDLSAAVAGRADGDHLLRQAVSVTNPVPAIEGREPEALARMAYRAPRAARTTLTAVVASDYERLLLGLPEVADARAVVRDVGLRQVVSVTVLLADEDTLTAHSGGSAQTGAEDVDRLDPMRDAERLRRWAVVRRTLEHIRMLGVDVELVPPVFVPLDLDVVVDAEPWAVADHVRWSVEEALAGDGGLFDPVALGGDVHLDAIHHRVGKVDGVAAVRVHRLRRLEPGARDHVERGTLAIGPEEVAILRRPYGLGADGLVTITVCGGLR